MPKVTADPKTMRSWVADLASEQREVRREAERKLTLIGERALPFVDAALRKPASLDHELRLKLLRIGLDSPEAGAPRKPAEPLLIGLLREIDSPNSRRLLRDYGYSVE